jgi:hypothetical protein
MTDVHLENTSEVETPKAAENEHRVIVEFDDGIYIKKLIHPEGGCRPVTTCSECYRPVDDAEATDSKPCPYCPTEADECWVQGWVDNTTASEILHGKVELSVEPDWDGDFCTLTVTGAKVVDTDA